MAETGYMPTLRAPTGGDDAERQRRLLAQALLQQGADASPIVSPWQGVARMAQAALGGWDLGRLDKERAGTLASENARVASAVGGGAPSVAAAVPTAMAAGIPAPAAKEEDDAAPAAPAPAMPAAAPVAPAPMPPAQPTGKLPSMALSGMAGPGSYGSISGMGVSPEVLNNAANALGSVESGNDYSRLGPVLKSGDRAHGYYQVMGNNIPSWTKEVLGRAMTPDEFLKNPDAQDSVFMAKFGQAAQKYGNLDDAASVWFSGRPMSKAGNASDGFNTVPEYVAKFRNALGMKLENPSTSYQLPPEAAQAGAPSTPQFVPSATGYQGAPSDALAAALLADQKPTTPPAEASSFAPVAAPTAPKLSPSAVTQTPAAAPPQAANGDTQKAVAGALQARQTAIQSMTDTVQRLGAAYQNTTDPAQRRAYGQQINEMLAKRDALAKLPPPTVYSDGSVVHYDETGKPVQIKGPDKDKEPGLREVNGQSYAYDKANPVQPWKPVGPKAAPTQAANVQWARENWKLLGAPDPNDPKNAEYWQGVTSKAIGGSGVTVNATANAEAPKLQTAEEQELGKGRGVRATALETAGAAAPEQLAKLNLLGNLLNKATTGKLGPAEATVAGWAQAFGIDPARVGLNPNQSITSDSAQKIINELVTGSIGKGGFPANNFSDADREFLIKMFPSIANRPEANAIALETMKRIEQRKMEAAAAWRAYQRKQKAENKSASFGEFEADYAESVQNKPMFADVQAMIEKLDKAGNGDKSSPGVADIKKKYGLE